MPKPGCDLRVSGHSEPSRFGFANTHALGSPLSTKIMATPVG
eukprot:CAMPEP_0205938922 /NCGR_PEP_ID=MMETSP1325-20131115/48205_1 /ASSEMBLY_ACC=CAM_ASM_000708 /TAXON_ID=236786 /ORGANISM="Florenciella sp., Strain RCC1007" /LENGTH=41 /DNA_ID= /DNA_START= /DNA_END= /DNA_ORIENTATION=